MENIIEVKQLKKDFDGFEAVNNVTFNVKKGEVFGLLGPNGAGKTTTIRMLIGILKPTQGEVFIREYNVRKEPIKVKQIMGIVPEFADAYTDLSALRNLLLTGELYGIERKRSIERAVSLLKKFELYDKRNQKVKTFSKGMRQRLILAMALMNDAEILFLDEPTSGLDVESTRLIRQLIRQFNKDGVTIFLTTHNIEEADLLCDRVAIMNQGKIIAIDRPELLKSIMKKISSIEVAFKKDLKEEDLYFKGVEKVNKMGDKFRVFGEKTLEIILSLIKYSKKSENEIISLRMIEPSLEDIFVKLTNKNENS
ncbi:MAG: ATP-binding cassette domain-containing protein [Candidatus Pacebacteria bacterium]|nr:ATP-binding cassette domain-containing protein [Candidatus Paceibacterota bacterium]MDD5721962.1 ATP-binding cassette domain-containing protein [Candidatus Paceibacterota bacterium]